MIKNLRLRETIKGARILEMLQIVLEEKEGIKKEYEVWKPVPIISVIEQEEARHH